ncbi:hypothetical protein DSY4680 [Desulfitobacterium hafniense Y51]|uniref:Uncharacterized protein n=1 Tax=Desulfitobacterium hafniense (strain Y51) TaxID=138119 RepID=Q24NC3_DESHY|nr:hypothetical protein DSY4680 [Desulfitobacterium hafniense Y51]
MAFPLKFVILRCHLQKCPMSSIKTLKKTGRKMHFFSPFFAHFLLQNHYIWWFTRLICPLNHYTSSLLYTQRAGLLKGYPRHRRPEPPIESTSCGNPSFSSIPLFQAAARRRVMTRSCCLL